MDVIRDLDPGVRGDRVELALNLPEIDGLLLVRWRSDHDDLNMFSATDDVCVREREGAEVFVLLVGEEHLHALCDLRDELCALAPASHIFLGVVSDVLFRQGFLFFCAAVLTQLSRCVTALKGCHEVLMQGGEGTRCVQTHSHPQAQRRIERAEVVIVSGCMTDSLCTGRSMKKMRAPREEKQSLCPALFLLLEGLLPSTMVNEDARCCPRVEGKMRGGARVWRGGCEVAPTCEGEGERWR